MDEDRTVIVSHLPEELTDIVEVYLESTKKGGGKIENFEYNKTRQHAVVTFESSVGEFNWYIRFNFCIYVELIRLSPTFLYST